MRFSYLRLLQLGSVADRVVLTDVTPAPAALATGLLLRHAAAEAVIVQDEAEEVIRAILHHHAMALSVSMGLLAYEGRSPAPTKHLDALDGLGSLRRAGETRSTPCSSPRLSTGSEA